MKKTISALLIISVLLVSIGFVFAAKPTSIENGVEKGWEKQAGCTTIQDGGLTDSAGNPISIGYDEFGYNYQAHMFNGRYCDSDRVIGGLYCDVDLIMKWNDGWMSNTDCDGWDVSGNWVITVNNGAYPHDYTFAMTSLPDGTFIGTGGYPAGSNDYTYDEIVIDGQIIEDTISFTAVYYQNNVATGYAWDATGTINADGELVEGTGTSGVYEWHSTSGLAVRTLDRHYGFNSYIGSGAWLTNHQSGTNGDGTKWTYFTKIVAKPTADFVCTEIGGAEIWGAFCKIQTVSNDPALDEHGVQLLADVPGFGFYNA